MLGATGVADVAATDVAQVEGTTAVVVGATGVGAGVLSVSIDHGTQPELNVGASEGATVGWGTGALQLAHSEELEGTGACDVGRTCCEVLDCQSDHVSLGTAGGDCDEEVGFG